MEPSTCPARSTPCILCLGLADLVDHQGERPIAITWKLRRAMPAETFQVARVVAS